MKKRKCVYHIMGQYHHSCSKICNYRLGSDRDGLRAVIKHYNYCPDCGVKITHATIKKQERI